MTVSDEEALSILTKWKNDGSSVRIQFRFSGIKGFVTGRVLGVAEGLILMGTFLEPRSEGDSPSALIEVPLVLVHSFVFVDPRDSGEERDVLASEMEFGLIAYFTTGECCAWYELPTFD
jgi:hypothetical protein